MENEVLKLILSVEDKSVIKATQEAKRLEKEIKALVATEKVLGKEHEIVKQKTIEIKRKLQDYANISSQKAVPTLKKLIQTERTLSREVDKNTAALTRNTKATKTAANATNQYGSYAAGAGKKLNTMNMRIQQGGYQLQDLVVQLQSGTSFFTAFGQQGSQFAGIFGPQGAVLGAVIAIGSAIGGMALGLARASENAKTFSDGMSDARSALDEYKNSIDRVKDADLAQVFGDNTQAIIDMDEASLEFSSNLAKLNLAAGFTDLTSSLDSSRTVMQGLAKDSLGLLATFNDIVTLGFFDFREKQQSMFSGESGLKSLGFTEGQLSKFGGSATLPNRLTGIQTQMQTGQFKDAAEGVQQIFDILKGSGDQLSASSLVFLDQLKSSVDAALEIQATFNGTAQAAKDAAEDAKQADEDEKNRIKDLAAAELKLWKENNEYIKEQKRLDAAGDLAILESQAQAERDLMDANSKYEREQDALRRRELDKTNKKVTELAERLSIPFAQALDLIRQAKAEATVGLDAFGGAGDFKYSVPTKFKPPKVGGAKAPRDPLKELMKNLRLQKRLFGVEEDRASVMKALGESYSKYTPEQIDAAIELTESIREQNEALKEQQEELDRLEDVAKGLVAPFDDFFMSLIDHTKKVSDSFNIMANDIIKELYRVLVVNQIVGGLTTFSTGVTELMSGSNPFVKFDGGGYTGSGSRSGGLDGKGGFMAMLHPRETVVDHAKGQSIGGGTVTVNQTINVSTGVQQTVRTEIKSLMPQIAEASKAAVADAKRRGGSYGRNFA
ncbi:hypothetical protein N8599_00350 [Verrucomicrobiales bacterium]|nr:hypothetical protein [Verrucomicrobiales bacterium]